MLQTTSLHRSGPTQTPFFYKGAVEQLKLDGKLEDVFCRRLDCADPDQSRFILREASALKALFTNPEVAIACAEAKQHYFSNLVVDLGQGPHEFHVTRMPSGDFRMVNSEEPGNDVHAQVILMEGGAHPHYAIMSTKMDGSDEEPELLQTVKMNFTGSQKFILDSETIHIGDVAQDSKAPHVPTWDFNEDFKDVRPFR